MKMKNLLLINAAAIVSFLIIIGLGLGTNTFSLTGFTFAEFYDTQVMYTLNAVSGETTTFVIPINNDQNEPIENVYAEIEIRDLDGNSIVTIDTEPIRVKENTRTEIKGLWENDVLPGEYIAIIYLASSEADASFTKTFKIEQRTITIESIQVEKFELGETINLDVIVQNHLESNVESATANILIYEGDQNIIDEIKTKATTLNASQINKLQTKWNTQGLLPGTYNAKIVVTGESYQAEEELVFVIGQNSLSVTGIGFAINYAPKGNLQTILVIIIIAGAIVLINILAWVLYRRRK